MAPPVRPPVGLPRRNAFSQRAAGPRPLPASPALAAPIVVFDWVTIPAGSFLMGSDAARDRAALRDELPQHTVFLPAFRIARVPVTNAQYAAFVRHACHPAPGGWCDHCAPPGRDCHPVVNVSWHDAAAFCAWASRVSGEPVRLPTEAEWEKAARGADGRLWPWGAEPPSCRRCNTQWFEDDMEPVGAHPLGASPYGVLDMAGNVWQWTGSLYQPYPYLPGDGREDAASPERRALRGGSFYHCDQLFDVRCAIRDGFDPYERYDHLGFRVASGA